MTVLFFLGTHQPSWLARTTVPLFVSHRRLMLRRQLPVARGPWALDSGGFTELSMYGEWRTSPAAYVEACRRYMTGIGSMAWAAPQDWMCEPHMLYRTGLSVDHHQALTVENVALLRNVAPDVPFVPVLQGWHLPDYLACVERYTAAGIDLTAEPTVGLGSVCRRQSTNEITHIVLELAAAGIACHGFGVKTKGIARYGHRLASADSLAWSFDARHRPPLPGCEHANCANCLRYALAWRTRVLRRTTVAQPRLWDAA